MNEFVWQDDYLLGNQTVDSQHKRLFELANQLIKSATKTELTNSAMQLYQHVREHFRAEEDFMKAQGYPDYQKHTAIHDLMLDQLVQVSEKINQDLWQQQEVRAFMQEWIHHILDEDAAINEYLQAKP